MYLLPSLRQLHGDHWLSVYLLPAGKSHTHPQQAAWLCWIQAVVSIAAWDSKKLRWLVQGCSLLRCCPMVMHSGVLWMVLLTNHPAGTFCLDYWSPASAVITFDGLCDPSS